MWLHKAIVTVLGLGYAPIAPGTFGTIGAFLLIALCHYFGIEVNTIPLLVGIVVSAVIGIWSTDKVIPTWGDDPSRVVIDEFVGFLITILFVPISINTLLLALVLFRFFDILKPLGIRKIDLEVKGGLGVMLDDVLAGVYACIVLHAILYFELLPL